MPYLGPLARAVWKLLLTLAIVASTTVFGTYLLFKLNRQHPQLPNGFGRFRTSRVVRIHIARTNGPFLIDYVPGRHRQSVPRFVVEPVQGDTERLVEVAQVIL